MYRTLLHSQTRPRPQVAIVENRHSRAAAESLLKKSGVSFRSMIPKALPLQATVYLLSEDRILALNCDSCSYFFLRILIVTTVFHEPSVPRTEEVNTL